MKGLLRRWREHELHSDDADTRLRTIEKLAGSKDPQAIELLMVGLEDPEPAIRTVAAEALGRRRDARAIRPLVRVVLFERERAVLEVATEALRHIGGSATATVLVTALDEDEISVRQAAARALRRVGWANLRDRDRARVAILQDEWQEAGGYGSAAIEPLREALCGGTQLARRRAAEALGGIGSDASAVALIETLKAGDLESGIRETAAWGIRRVCWENVNESDLALAAVVLGDWSGAAGLGGAAVAALSRCLYHDDTDVRRRAAETLYTIGGEEATSALIETLCNAGQDVEVREHVASLFAQRSDAPTEGALVSALSDESWSVRVAGANALEEREWTGVEERDRVQFAIARKDWEGIRGVGPAAIDALVGALSFHAVGGDAARTLVALGQPGQDALVDVLHREGENSSVREVASIALAESGDVRAVDPVRAMLKEPDSAVQQFAVWTLERLGWTPSTAAERAIAAIAHGDWEEVKGLGAPAVDPLLRLMAEAMAPEEAADSLEHILDAVPGRLSIDHLRKLASLDAPRKGGAKSVPELAGWGSGGGVRKADCSKIRHLAKYELLRRGIMT